MEKRTIQGDLEERLRDPEFAGEFGSAQARSALAVTLAQAREEKGVTQSELAGRLNVSQAYVAKLEGGEANPTFGRIGRFLASMGLRLTTGTARLSPYPVVGITTASVGGGAAESIPWGDPLWGDTLTGVAVVGQSHSEPQPILG